MKLGSTVGEAAWSECESVIRRFEDAWRGSERPDVGDFLAPASPHSVRLLVELVHIDLEFRLRANEEARVEEYLARFPKLRTPEVLLDLLAAEFALRNRHGLPAWPEEYWLRFPEHMRELRARMPVEGVTGWFHATRPVEFPGAPLAGPPAIAGYEVEGELGRGGMGVVYKARDLLLHRTVAVKTFATVPRPESCARFAREAESIARLDHPHIVPVYEVGEWRTGDGHAVPYFVMKWYTGGSLDAAPAGPGTPPAVHARLVETIARAVHHAHQRGVLHRDLKPSNILLDDVGQPHVADFGLAGRVDPDAPTLTAVVAGTPAYMAPEQARGPKTVSTAVDVYGLGAILYHQLTGRPPFAAETPLATLDLVASEPPARPSAINPAVPRDLDTICLKCLEKDPTRRYASAEELACDLERWRKGLPIAARPARTWELAWRRVRRHPVVSALTLTTVAALVGAVVVLAESNARICEKEKEAQLAYLRECAMRYKLEDALARDQTTRLQLEETLRRELRALYLERVSSAGRLYAANQLAEAWVLLDQCPEQFRGWEWRYLDSLRQKSPVTLTGHTAQVTQVAFLADGRLISADADGYVRVWDAAGQRSEREWKCGETRVVALATHPTKDWVAVADINAVTVWEVGTSRRLAKLDGAEWVAFAPDCPRLAAAHGSTVRFWTVPVFVPPPGDPRPLPEWKQEGALYGHREQVRAGAFTPEGNVLFTASADGTVRSWAVARGTELSGRTVPTPVSGLGVAAGGKLLVEAHAGYVLFTDPGSGEMRDRLDHPTGYRTRVAVSPDGRLVAVGGANGELVVWDVATRRKRVYRGHPGRVSALAFGRDGRLASAGGDQTVRLWDVGAEQDVRTLAWVGPGTGGITVSPDGTRVAIGPRVGTATTYATALVFDAATGRELRRVNCWPDLVFHPISGHLVTSRPNGEGATLWDLGTGNAVWSKPFFAPRDPGMIGPPGGRRMALDPTGMRLAAWDLRAGGVQLWHAADGTDAGVLDTGKVLVYATDFSPDGSRLAVAAHDAVSMWDVRTRTRLPWGEGLPGALAVAYSPNGQWVATADLDRVVRLRDAATGRVVRQFVGTALRASALCFSPDSTRLLTGGADRTVRVWDVESGRELLSLPGVTEAVSGIVWDGPRDRIYALDHAVRIWGTKDN